MRIRVAAVAALFASLAAASAASAQVAPMTMPIATPAPTSGHTNVVSFTPLSSGNLGQMPVTLSWQVPPSSIPSTPPAKEAELEDELRQRQEQMDRLMAIMRQMQEQRDAATRRAAGGG